MNQFFDDTGVRQAYLPSHIIHDDHLLSVGIGAPNAQRKDVGKAAQSGPVARSRDPAAGFVHEWAVSANSEPSGEEKRIVTAPCTQSRGTLSWLPP